MQDVLFRQMPGFKICSFSRIVELCSVLLNVFLSQKEKKRIPAVSESF